MSKFKIFVILMLCSLSSAFAQEDYEAIYERETLVGLNLNTNAGRIGGLTFRHSVFIKDRHYHVFGAEMVNVKHNHEEHVVSTQTGSPFIYGKSNYFLPLRLSYGRTYVLFPKDRDEGVQVDLTFKGGPSFGILKPYIISYDYTALLNSSRTVIRTEGYDHTKHQFEKILGKGNFFAGFGDSKIVPGLHFTTSCTFTFVNMNNNFSGLETGFNIEAYPQAINIMPFAHNRWLFTSVFINIIYGTRH